MNEATERPALWLRLACGHYVRFCRPLPLGFVYDARFLVCQDCGPQRSTLGRTKELWKILDTYGPLAQANQE